MFVPKKYSSNDAYRLCVFSFILLSLTSVTIAVTRSQQQQHTSGHLNQQLNSLANTSNATQTQRVTKQNNVNQTSTTNRNLNTTGAYIKRPTATRGAVESSMIASEQTNRSNKRRLNSSSSIMRLEATPRSLLDDISQRLDYDKPNVSLDYDTRIPFWNIAHMINSIEQIDIALSAGANGIETDVSFNSRGVPVEAYHGFPCDCGRHCHHRNDFVDFVKQVGRQSLPPTTSQLFVVLFDLKLKDLKETQQKEMAGLSLAKIIYENIYSPYQTQATNIQMRSAQDESSLIIRPPVRVILSINHASDLPLVRSFIRYMRDNRLDFMSQQVGFDVGMNDKLSDISAMWDDLNGAVFNIWQGDGLTNCANIIRGVERLKEAISIRNGQGHFKKVYYWTADVLYHIRSVLRLGIDAVLTNQPQRVVQVLEESEFRDKYRLATAYDNPFEQFHIKPTAWSMSVPSLSEAKETVANIQKTGSNFIKTLPDGISAALSKVHSSIGLPPIK